MNSKKIALFLGLTFVIGIALSLVQQLLNLWMDGTPMLFTVMTMVAVPLMFVLVCLLVPLSRLALRHQSRIRSVSLLSFISNAVFWLAFLFYQDLSDELLVARPIELHPFINIVIGLIAAAIFMKLNINGDRKYFGERTEDSV